MDAWRLLSVAAGLCAKRAKSAQFPKLNVIFAHHLLDRRTTDARGEARFDYRGTYSGADVVQAAAVIDGQGTTSVEVQVTWTPPP